MRKWDMNSRFGIGVLLKLIRENPGISIPEIKQKVDSNSTAIYRNVSSLLQRRYIYRYLENRSEFGAGIGMIARFTITEEGRNKLENV
jgi:predicted transcriptional regulator